MRKRQKKTNSRRQNIRITKILVLFAFAFILVFSIYQIYTKRTQILLEDSNIECTKNSDCLIIRGSCCSCEEGGAPQCIPKSQIGIFTKELESCSSKGSCFNLDCGKISCGCIENKCVGKYLD
jgi:hypothetical protein